MKFIKKLNIGLVLAIIAILAVIIYSVNIENERKASKQEIKKSCEEFISITDKYYTLPENYQTIGEKSQDVDLTNYYTEMENELKTKTINDLVYNYAVMRCKENQFLALDPADIIVYRKRDFQIDVLVSDCKAMQRKYKEIVIDHVSVDEIFLLLVRGDHV